MAFHKVLIANRGEIAVRVIRSCKQHGYRTVAVFSDADREAPHVAAADEAVHLGPSPARESYLALDKIVAAARSAGAGAIHPGYGFLAENADFARACAAAGLVFIGPGPAAIALMGNKRQAKRRMLAAGVPCIPGYEGDEQSDEALAREARCIGLPVMVKAAAGGGGRGMRLVTDDGQLSAAIQSARSEAAHAFGSGELFLEKVVIGARHVEVQVFADRHGHVVHLGERDCSVQRRHQKIVEEAPSPAVDAALRRRLGEIAVAATRAIDYVGAGTVEFLLAPDGALYFMEMNTRLQVEHPVTELITGLDLVAWQLAIAAGEPLPLGQDDLRFSGHAIEVRLCAEDPERDFLPQTGRLLDWRVPDGAGVRVDHGVRAGQVVTPFYDSMLAKLIAHGPTREAARRRLLQALADTTLLGLVSNRDLLRHILEHEAFVEGAYDTGFIAAHFAPRQIADALAPTTGQIALAAAVLYHDDALALRDATGCDPSLVGWNSAFNHPIRLVLARETVEHAVTLRSLGCDRYAVTVGDDTLEVALSAAASAGAVRYLCAGVQGQARYARDHDRLWLDTGSATHAFTDVTLRPPKVTGAAGDGRLVAPMDGRIIAVSVTPGQAVKKGQPVLVLEAMKLELPVPADVDGTVEAIQVAVGAQVRARQLLATVTAAPPCSVP